MLYLRSIYIRNYCVMIYFMNKLKKYLISTILAFSYSLQCSGYNSRTYSTPSFKDDNPLRNDKPNKARRWREKESQIKNEPCINEIPMPFGIGKLMDAGENPKKNSIEKIQGKTRLNKQNKSVERFLAGKGRSGDSEIEVSANDLYDFENPTKSRSFDDIKDFFLSRKDYLDFKQVMQKFSKNIELTKDDLNFLNKTDLFDSSACGPFSTADLIKKWISNHRSTKENKIHGICKLPELEMRLNKILNDILGQAIDKAKFKGNRIINILNIGEIYERFFRISHYSSDFGNFTKYQ